MNKNLKYSTYIVFGILVLGFILAISSCRDAFQNVPLQQPSAYQQQPIQYDNDVYYHSDNTAANLAAAAAVGAAAGYATNKYMDKQKQVSTPAPVKVNPSPVPVTKPTTSKPSFSYLTSKSSSSSRSTSSRSSRRR